MTAKDWGIIALVVIQAAYGTFLLHDVAPWVHGVVWLTGSALLYLQWAIERFNRQIIQGLSRKQPQGESDAPHERERPPG